MKQPSTSHRFIKNNQNSNFLKKACDVIRVLKHVREIWVSKLLFILILGFLLSPSGGIAEETTPAVDPVSMEAPKAEEKTEKKAEKATKEKKKAKKNQKKKKKKAKKKKTPEEKKDSETSAS